MSYAFNHGLTRADGFAEREASIQWCEDSGTVYTNPAVCSFLERVGRTLERLLGSSITDQMFAAVEKHFELGTSNWRDTVDQPQLMHITEVGKRVTRLTGYAVFGMVRDESDHELDVLICSMEELIEDWPADLWEDEDGTFQLYDAVTLARTRWDLDQGLSLTPEGLALIGGVKLSRIRNMMAGNAPELPKDAHGYITNMSARAWLDSRDSFLPTIRQPKQDMAQTQVAEMVTPVFLPIARDGSAFTPDLAENGSYRIGDRGLEQELDDFDEALEALQSMPVAKWRRPNGEGHWSSVTAVEWKRFDRRALERPSPET